MAVQAPAPGKWYVIHIKTGYEARVKAALEQRANSLGVADRIFEIVVPMRETINVKKGKKVKAKVILAGLLVLGWVDVARVHPNYLAYFNSFSGGLSGGSYWLADSDQDWGQSLPSLARELKRRPPGLLLLSYSGAAYPEADGLPYVDLVSAAIVSRVHKNPPLPEHGGSIYLAVGTKMAQIAPDFFAWLESHRQPEKLIDGTFRLYDLSHDGEALRWVGNCFQVLKRKEEADWFHAEAQKSELSQAPIR
jgi:hypothetical protein